MFHKILVALNGSDSSKQVFDKAVALAQATHAHLMLLHVLTPFDEGYPTPIFPGADGVYPMMHQEAMEHYMKQLEIYEKKGLELLRSLTAQAVAVGVRAEFNQAIGSPGQAICSLAGSWGADLILMGRRGRTGISELLLGSVSNYVTHHATCSVLIVQGKDNRYGEVTQENQIAVGQ